MVADQEKMVTVIAMRANQALQTEVIIGWTHGAKDKVELANLGTLENPRYIKINADAPTYVKIAAIELFHEYQDILAWGHEDLGLPTDFSRTHHRSCTKCYTSSTAKVP